MQGPDSDKELTERERLDRRAARDDAFNRRLSDARPGAFRESKQDPNYGKRGKKEKTAANPWSDAGTSRRMIDTLTRPSLAPHYAPAPKVDWRTPHEKHLAVIRRAHDEVLAALRRGDERAGWTALSKMLRHPDLDAYLLVGKNAYLSLWEPSPSAVSLRRLFARYVFVPLLPDLQRTLEGKKRRALERKLEQIALDTNHSDRRAAELTGWSRWKIQTLRKRARESSA